MQRVQFNRYGAPDVLEMGTAPTPEPAAGEALVRVAAAAVNPKDCLVRKGKFRLITGKRFPQTLGQDFAGRIETLGAGVDDLHPGQHVFGMLNRWSGGAYAEYLRAPAGELAPMPETLSFEQAAAVPLAGMTALQALRDLAGLQEGRRVLINGASGGVGSFAVQIAKHLGATVTAVCSARNAELVAGLGADTVVDYRAIDPLDLRERFHVVFDVFGNKPYPRARHLLTARGVHVTTIPNAANVIRHLATRLSPLKRGLLVAVRSRRRDLDLLSDWIRAGRIHPVIDRSYPLAEAARAHAYIETKRARGKVVLLP